MMYDITQFLDWFDDNNRDKCWDLYADNIERFQRAWGSSHNHQAWEGGYLDHVEEVMNIAVNLYDSMEKIRPLPFQLKDALLVLFLHDLEKLWKGEFSTNTVVTKFEKRAFRYKKITEYNIYLTPEQENALRYVEGEGDDYRNDKRVMNELAAFCHMCDVASARIWHDKP